MDRLEQTVQRERMEKEVKDNGTDENGHIPNDAGFDHPMIQKWWKNYQGKQRQLADKERELDRQLQQIALVQQQMNHSAGPSQAAPKMDAEFDYLDPSLQELTSQNPQLRALLKSLEKKFGSRESDSGVSQLQSKIDELQAQLQQTQSAFTQERYMRQIPEFQKKWGGALDGEMQEQILRHALQTGSDLERALYAVSPETALAQERKRMEAEIKAKYDAEYGAYLEGMEDVVSSQPEPNRKPVDANGRMRPFSETAVEVLGKGGMMQALRDGMAREEAVAPEGNI